MKVPTRPDSVVATNRAAARRQLAFSTITNFSELKAAFSEAVVPAIERHIKNRLMSVKRGAATIVFLDGPFLLIDLSTRLTAGIRNRLLSRREIGADAVKRLLERLQMGNLASHQEDKRIFDARIVRHVNQPLVDNLGARLRRDVRTKVGSRLTNGDDVDGVRKLATGISQRRTAAIEHLGHVRIVAGTLQLAILLCGVIHAFSQFPFGALVQHGDEGSDDF